MAMTDSDDELAVNHAGADGESVTELGADIGDLVGGDD